jgi:hypothetical protein
MKDNRLGGIALIIGAVSGMITMSLHPVGGAHVMNPQQFERLLSLVIGVHVLAIAGIPFLFLGALALSRELNSPARLSLLALASYSMGLVAIVVAPAVSGLVGAELLRKIAAPGPEADSWRMVMSYNHMINQAFTRIYVVASAAAIALWSLEMAWRGSLSRIVGILGLILAAVGVAITAAGFHMDAHVFAIVVFAGSIWLIVVAILLMRAPVKLRGPGVSSRDTYGLQDAAIDSAENLPH